MIRPTMPAIIRISPTDWMSIQDTDAVTAYFSTAPTAMSSMDVPICIIRAYPARRASNHLAPQPSRVHWFNAGPRLPSPPFETRTTHSRGRRGRAVGRREPDRRRAGLGRPRADLGRAGRGTAAAPGLDHAGRHARPGQGAGGRRGG